MTDLDGIDLFRLISPRTCGSVNMGTRRDASATVRRRSFKAMSLLDGVNRFGTKKKAMAIDRRFGATREFRKKLLGRLCRSGEGENWFSHTHITRQPDFCLSYGQNSIC